MTGELQLQVPVIVVFPRGDGPAHAVDGGGLVIPARIDREVAAVRRHGEGGESRVFGIALAGQAGYDRGESTGGAGGAGCERRRFLEASRTREARRLADASA